MKFFSDIWVGQCLVNDSKYFEYGNIHKKYELASLSKAFTALAILIMEVRGQISLDDSVTEYNEKFKFYYYKNKKIENVTFRMLLQHTAGINSNTIRFQLEGATSIQKAAEKIVSVKLKNRPGEKFEYVTGGYIVLGALIETISNCRFKDYICENILLPLNMCDSMSDGKNIPGLKKSFLRYRFLHWKGCPAFTPAGYIVSTGNDMTKWLKAQLYPERLPGDLRKAIDLSHNTVYYKNVGDGGGVRYGFGWYWDENTELYFHDGCNPCFTTYTAFHVQSNTSMICMLAANDGSFSKCAHNKMQAVIAGDEVELSWSKNHHIIMNFLLLLCMGLLIALVIHHSKYALLLIPCLAFSGLITPFLSQGLKWKQINLWLSDFQLMILWILPAIILLFIVNFLCTYL